MNKEKSKNINLVLKEYEKELHRFKTLLLTSYHYLKQTISNGDEAFVNIISISTLLRQAIELLIFSTLKTQEENDDLMEKLKNLQTKKFIDKMDKINPNWFPIPIYKVECEWTKEDLNKKNIDTNSNPKKILWISKNNCINKKILMKHYDFISNFIYYKNLNYEFDWNDKNQTNHILGVSNNIINDLNELIKSYFIHLEDHDFVLYITLDQEGNKLEVLPSTVLDEIDKN